jgi:hypothetical protein
MSGAILQVVKIWIPATGWLVALTLGAAATGEVAPAPIGTDYLVYVASEAADKISLVRFGREGGRLDRDLTPCDAPLVGAQLAAAGVRGAFNALAKPTIVIAKRIPMMKVRARGSMGPWSGESMTETWLKNDM